MIEIVGNLILISSSSPHYDKSLSYYTRTVCTTIKNIPKKNLTVKKSQVPNSLPKSRPTKVVKSTLWPSLVFFNSYPHCTSTLKSNTPLLFVLFNTWPVSEWVMNKKFLMLFYQWFSLVFYCFKISTYSYYNYLLLKVITRS
jgi:hypothetical protein